MANYVPETPRSISEIRTELDKVAAAIQTVLHRDGTAPNQMSADLDMNGNDLLNARVGGAPLDTLIEDSVNATAAASTAATRANTAAEAAEEVVDDVEGVVGDIVRNPNLLYNHNFLIPSALTVNNTPQDVAADVEIFSGVFAGASGVQGLTYVNGLVSFTGGTIVLTLVNTEAVSRTTVYVASVAGFEGEPRTRGVSFALVGDDYHVTVTTDALTDAEGNTTPLGSVKLEQGTVATGHGISLGVLASGSDTPRFLEDRFSETINVKNYGAVGGGVVDDSLAIGAAIAEFRTRILAGQRVKLEFPTDVYKCSGLVWNLSSLGAAQSLIEGNNSVIEFDSLGNSPAMVDLINSREISIYNIRLRYGGVSSRPVSECPMVGMLFARNAANDYSGRHKLFNVFVTGTYQLSSFYNAGCEENAYYHVEFRNNLTGRRACVVTSSNHLGATSSFETITTTNISTTLNVFIKPVFWTDGRAREAVCLRGVGGLTLLNPYSSSGAIAHYAIQAIDSTVSGVSITGYQAEVDRGSIGVSADYIFRFEGDGTLDVINCDIKAQFSTKVLGEGTIEGVRDFKRTNITVGGLVRDVGSSRSIQGCDIRAAAGLTLNSISELVASNFYADLKDDIDLPNVSSNCTVTATDIEGELSIGKFRQKATTSTVTLDASVVGLDGGGTVTNFNSDFNGVGLPFVEQRFYCYGAGANVTIENGTGNILTNTQADVVLATGQYIEVRYLGHADKYFVRRMTGG